MREEICLFHMTSFPSFNYNDTDKALNLYGLEKQRHIPAKNFKYVFSFFSTWFFYINAFIVLLCILSSFSNMVKLSNLGT